jgi:hypothetical protein
MLERVLAAAGIHCRLLALPDVSIVKKFER